MKVRYLWVGSDIPEARTWPGVVLEVTDGKYDNQKMLYWVPKYELNIRRDACEVIEEEENEFGPISP